MLRMVPRLGGRGQSSISSPFIRRRRSLCVWEKKTKRAEASRSKCTEEEEEVHPVFEKLEFYLNLKNDFALTFIRDERRVYFFSK